MLNFKISNSQCRRCIVLRIVFLKNHKCKQMTSQRTSNASMSGQRYPIHIAMVPHCPSFTLLCSTISYFQDVYKFSFTHWSQLSCKFLIFLSFKITRSNLWVDCHFKIQKKQQCNNRMFDKFASVPIGSKMTINITRSKSYPIPGVPNFTLF